MGIVIYHYIVDGNLPIKSREEAERLAREIAKEIDMLIVSGPHAFEGEKDPGFTVLTGIEYSSITIHHFSEDNHFVFIDVTSCKEFSKDKIKKFLEEKGMKIKRELFFIRDTL